MFFPPRNWSRRFGTQFFTVEIKAANLSEDEKGAEKCAFYSIIVKRGKQERLIKRRYSEFYEFHRLLVRFSSYARRCNFPPKTWFRNVSESFLEERRELLDKYLQQVLHDQRIARHKYTIAFLNLNNFDLYKWWDFQEQGFSEYETDIDPSLRERALNSKHNRKSKSVKEDSEISFKNRSNSLFSSNPCNQQQEITTEINKEETVQSKGSPNDAKTIKIPAVEPEPFELPIPAEGSSSSPSPQETGI